MSRLLVGVTAVILATAAGCSSRTPPPKAPIHIRGAVVVSFLGSNPSPSATFPIAQQAADTTNSSPPDPGSPPVGDACAGTGDYSDIVAGTALVLADQNGNTLGTGVLRAGVVAVKPATADTAICSFAFDVTVSAYESSYTVTIAHRPARIFDVGTTTTGDSYLTALIG